MSRSLRSAWAGLAALAAVTALTSCGFLTGNETANDTADSGGECSSQTLRLATIRAETDPTTIAAEKFAELVEGRTDGELTVEVFPNSQLGDFTDIFAEMASGGNVDMFYEGISIYNTLDGAKAFTVMSVPFLFDSYQQMLNVLRSDRFQQLFEEATKASGVRVIVANGDAEPRALSANRPIRNADDMQGLKIRIAEAPMPQAFARALGAAPTVIPFSDLYLALRQGVADAQENGAITMVTQSLYEVQDYYMPIDYIRDVRSWYISEQVWTSLCPSQQEALTTAGTEAGKLGTREVQAQLDKSMDTLRQQITVVDDVDVASFKQALDGVFEEKFDGKLWQQGLLDEIEQLKTSG
ncbi:MAG: TRAP transporter substrate-binding protein [Haloechinothrix sp.]